MLGCAGIISLGLIYFGVLFLLENLGVGNQLASRYWPIFLIFLGIVSLINMGRIRAKIRRYQGRQPPYIDR